MKKIVLYISFLYIIGCSGEKQPQGLDQTQTGKFKSPVSLKADTILTGDSEILIGSVRGLSTGPEGDIYLLDNSSNKILRFNDRGDFKKEYLSGEGRGPGETIRPNTFFVDRLGYLYITDQSEKRFSVFSPDGKLFHSQVIRMMPSGIAAFDSSEVFLSGFRFSYSDSNIVEIYSLNDDTYYKTGSIGVRTPGGNEMLLNFAGQSDFVTVTGSRLIISRYYPYHFEIFNKNLELIAEQKREPEGFKPPYREKGIVQLDAFGREVLFLSGFNIVRYRYKEEDFFDVYDKVWNYKETLSSDNIGIEKEGKYYASNPEKAEIYVVYEDPEFKLVKYSF